MVTSCSPQRQRHVSAAGESFCDHSDCGECDEVCWGRYFQGLGLLPLVLPMGGGVSLWGLVSGLIPPRLRLGLADAALTGLQC
ncbi:hypothetical protein [Acetobacter indonesiensis]|uniref:hypothetical protein n=1 Tax=Acetobacter indonesiensis TaxID=104101 RepID=UPI0039EA2960